MQYRTSVSLGIFILTLLFGFINTAFAAEPVNYWPLDEGIGRETRDMVGGKNGTLFGSSPGFGWASGKVGVGLAMDGVTGEGVILPEGFLSGGSGSVSVWFRLNQLTDRNILFSGRSTSDHSVYMALLIDREGRPMVQMRETASNPDRRTQGATILNKNEWYHLVMTVDSQKRFRFYVNGVEHDVAGDGLPRWFGDLTNQKLAYRIGSLDSSPLSGSLDGTIDDVRIYDTVLTPSEVEAIFNETNEMGPTVPVEQRPTVTLSADPLVLPTPGKSTLTWKTTNVTSCTKGGSWQGQAGPSGSEVVTVTGNSTYTIECSGKGGTMSAAVTLEIGDTQGTGSLGQTSEVPTQTITLVNPMTEVERQAKIAELRAKIMELITKLSALVAQMQAAR
jgi:hypothetical protein